MARAKTTDTDAASDGVMDDAVTSSTTDASLATTAGTDADSAASTTAVPDAADGDQTTADATNGADDGAGDATGADDVLEPVDLAQVLIPMAHPDGGTADAYETDEAGNILVPAIEAGVMMEHGFLPVGA